MVEDTHTGPSGYSYVAEQRRKAEAVLAGDAAEGRKALERALQPFRRDYPITEPGTQKKLTNFFIDTSSWISDENRQAEAHALAAQLIEENNADPTTVDQLTTRLVDAASKAQVALYAKAVAVLRSEGAVQVL